MEGEEKTTARLQYQLEQAQGRVERRERDIRDAILEAVHEFVGDVTQRDDIALGVVVRDAA